MKFSNTVAYCKGFYKSRGNVDEMWKDFSHCIQVDGWMCYTKKDVARWCSHRIEDFAKEFPKEAWKVSFGMIYSKMQEFKNIWENCYSNEPLEDYDYIIWAFRDFIKYNTEDSHFTEGVIPNDIVLPVFDGVSEELWNHICSKYKEQSENDFLFISYEERENCINKIY